MLLWRNFSDVIKVPNQFTLRYGLVLPMSPLKMRYDFQLVSWFPVAKEISNMYFVWPGRKHIHPVTYLMAPHTKKLWATTRHSDQPSWQPAKRQNINLTTTRTWILPTIGMGLEENHSWPKKMLVIKVCIILSHCICNNLLHRNINLVEKGYSVNG